MKNIIPLSLLFLLSCSQINQVSRDQYKSDHPQFKTRHGVIPLDSKEMQKSEQNRIAHHLDEASLERGKFIYQKSCLPCHGESGRGDGPLAGEQPHPPANLQKLAREVPNFKFFMSISQWQGDMPGWKEQYNESDREDLVSYIKSFR